MACPRCTARALRPSLHSQPQTRTFTTTPHRQKLGAALYAQDWNTGTYHYNKSTAKLAPFAHKQTDKMLQQFITQQRKRSAPATSTAAPTSSGNTFQSKAAIAAHRRKYEKMYVSGSRVKDFGGRVEVEAFVFDAGKAAERDQAARDAKRSVAGKGEGSGGGGGEAGVAAGAKGKGQAQRRQGGGR